MPRSKLSTPTKSTATSKDDEFVVLKKATQIVRADQLISTSEVTSEKTGNSYAIATVRLTTKDGREVAADIFGSEDDREEWLSGLKKSGQAVCHIKWQHPVEAPVPLGEIEPRFSYRGIETLAGLDF